MGPFPYQKKCWDPDQLDHPDHPEHPDQIYQPDHPDPDPPFHPICQVKSSTHKVSKPQGASQTK